MSTASDRRGERASVRQRVMSWRAPVRFAAMMLLLGLGAIVAIVAIFLVVPDGNDYARVSILKHNRIASLPSPKIVLIGGSNLAYGVDSRILEQETKCPVVNMGMNGHLGVRFMLDEATPYLKKSDIVVISFEYENFFSSVYGHFPDQLMISKTNPRSWSHLAWWQKLGALAQLPMVAQQKVFRVIRSYVSMNQIPEDELVGRVEQYSGFNEYGDLTSHLDKEWTYPDTDRFDLSSLTMDSNIIPELRSFTERMNRMGVHTIYSYSPLKRSFYDIHKKAIDALHKRLINASPIVVPNPPKTFVFENGFFFDSIYHLNAEGRAPRTKQLGADIRDTVFRGGDCTMTPLAEKAPK